MSKKQTSPVELDLEGVDAEIRIHPLPATEALDEFLVLGAKLEGTGALSILIGGATGVGFNPMKWDMADAAVMLRTLVTATGQSAGKLLLDVFKRYGVEHKHAGAWVALDTIDAMNDALDAFELSWVLFECLRNSISPFFTRLKSLAKAREAKQAKLSTESAETS